MGKYFSLGEYNKLYKYIWIYLIIRFIYQFIFNQSFVFEQLYYEPMIVPYAPFISFQFDYMSFIIVSLVLIMIEKLGRKKELNQELIEGKLIYNEPDIILKFGVQKGDYFLFINIFFVVILDMADEIITKFNCYVLNYWMFEMFFFEIFSTKILKSNIYKHNIFSFIFILTSCSIIQTIYIILNFVNETENVSIFDGRKWLILLGVIYFILVYIGQAYVYCNEKYYLDKRYIQIKRYLLLYGIFGLITSSIFAILSSYIPCGDNTLSELSKIVCNYKDDAEIYYFSSYSSFFEKFSSSYLGLRIILLIIQSLLYYTSNYYIYVIYKKLNPIYHICMKRLNFLIIDILGFFNYLANKEIQSLETTLYILEILILIFYLSGSLVYLEFIELHFCGLDFYIKRKINERSSKENLIDLENISEVSDGDLNE